MSEQLNREILDELKNINRKLDTLSKPKGLSASTKLIAVIIGFTVIGPLILIAIALISSMVRN